jgi:c-di-GMP-binding flagellar brake protein YcgR
VSHAEHRQHPRVFFNDNSDIVAHIERTRGDGKGFAAFVMNMSVGGMGISTHERISGMLKQGDALHLNFIKQRGSTSPVRGIAAQVQWVLEEPTSDKLVIGLEFIGVDSLMASVIQKFLDNAQS